MIPEGWKETELGKVSICLDNRRIPLKESDREKRIGPYPYCGANGILSHIDDYLFDEDIILLAEDGGNYEDFASRPIAYRMTGKCWVNNHAHVVVAADGVDQGYLFHSLKHKDIRSLLASSTRAKLNRSELVKIPVVLPPLVEQRAIAEALSHADALVESLDALIAKKRDMKQAAMQQLLTGRTRLPGFSEEWLSLLIGDIASLSAAPAKMSGGSHYVIVDMGSVAMDGSLLTHKKTDEKEDLLEVGDLVMPKDDIGGGQIIGKAIHIDVPNRYVLGDHVYRLRLSQGHPLYVRYAINSHSVNSSLRSKVVGSAQLGLGRRSVLEQPILFPPLDEQQAIAEVLSDMDAEIDAFVAQREKAELVKQGMMQELLSGRVRLV